MTEFDLQIFCTDWSRAHSVQFCLDVSDEGNPTGIVLRYPKKDYGNVAFNHWFEIIASAKSISDGAMFIASSQRMSSKGLLEFTILSESENYDPEKIATALTQISNIIAPPTDGSSPSPAAQ